MSTAAILSDPREAREFVEAKRRKREPIRFTGHGASEAECYPRTDFDFNALRRGLRESSDFSRASERLDALERHLVKARGRRLPCPRKMVQNTDRSLTLWWGKAMVRCFDSGSMTLVNGKPNRRITNELLDEITKAAPWQT